MGRCPWLAVTVWTWMLWMTSTGHGRDEYPWTGQGRGLERGVTEGDQPRCLIAITDQPLPHLLLSLPKHPSP